MPRANRHYIPGYIWHITHRCHKKEFFLKFARDRRRWLQWLFEAGNRYGLSVLNYMVMVTSNHIHLLVRDNGERDVYPQLNAVDSWKDGDSVAVGSALFVNATKEKLGMKGKGRKVIGADGSWEL